MELFSGVNNPITGFQALHRSTSCSCATPHQIPAIQRNLSPLFGR